MKRIGVLVLLVSLGLNVGLGLRLMREREIQADQRPSVFSREGRGGRHQGVTEHAQRRSLSLLPNSNGLHRGSHSGHSDTGYFLGEERHIAVVLNHQPVEARNLKCFRIAHCRCDDFADSTAVSRGAGKGRQMNHSDETREHHM